MAVAALSASESDSAPPTVPHPSDAPPEDPARRVSCSSSSSSADVKSSGAGPRPTVAPVVADANRVAASPASMESM